MNIINLQKLAKLIRFYILLMTTTAGSGHTTSSLSATDIMTALFFTEFRADLDNPPNPTNDRLIFSKGHASPLFYALYRAAGKLSDEDLAGYRKFTSNLEGHPTLAFPYTEAPTGSLGQGLSIGVGMAIALRAQSQKSKVKSQNYSLKFKSIHNSQHTTHNSQLPRVFVLLGDGETAEGSVWEAVTSAVNYKLDNLITIVDVNRLGQSQETMYGHNLEAYRKKFEGFGCDVSIVEGHNISEILKVFEKIGKTNSKPFVILAKTYKGYGISLLQDKDNWHGKPLPKDMFDQAVKELGAIDYKMRGEVRRPVVLSAQSPKSLKLPKSLKYKMGDQVATRQAIGDAITHYMYKYPEVVVLDGDVKNSLYTESTQKEHPDRYFEMYIAEQNMTGVAVGLWRRGAVPIVTTFAAFMTRCYDQVRMAGLAGANIKFFGSHAGVSIGEDGASQMGLEDLSMFRSVYNSVVINPCDAVSSRNLVEEMIKHKGICYIRAARPATPVIYDNSEKFPIGGCKVHKVKSQKSKVKTTTQKSKVIIISAGVTLYEALKAQEELAKEGIEAVVVNCYSIKPIDAATLKNLIRSTFARGGLANGVGTVPVITVEDHWFDGGLGDAVLNVFSTDPKVNVYKLAVSKLPHSGKPAELLDFEEISAGAIIQKVKSIV